MYKFFVFIFFGLGSLFSKENECVNTTSYLAKKVIAVRETESNQVFLVTLQDGNKYSIRIDDNLGHLKSQLVGKTASVDVKDGLLLVDDIGQFCLPNAQFCVAFGEGDTITEVKQIDNECNFFITFKSGEQYCIESNCDLCSSMKDILFRIKGSTAKIVNESSMLVNDIGFFCYEKVADSLIYEKQTSDQCGIYKFPIKDLGCEVFDNSSFFDNLKGIRISGCESINGNSIYLVSCLKKLLIFQAINKQIENSKLKGLFKSLDLEKFLNMVEIGNDQCFRAFGLHENCKRAKLVQIQDTFQLQTSDGKSFCLPLDPNQIESLDAYELDLSYFFTTSEMQSLGQLLYYGLCELINNSAGSDFQEILEVLSLFVSITQNERDITAEFLNNSQRLLQENMQFKELILEALERFRTDYINSFIEALKGKTMMCVLSKSSPDISIFWPTTNSSLINENLKGLQKKIKQENVELVGFLDQLKNGQLVNLNINFSFLYTVLMQILEDQE